MEEEVGKWTVRQMDRQTDRQTDSQADGQSVKQTVSLPVGRRGRLGPSFGVGFPHTVCYVVANRGHHLRHFSTATSTGKKAISTATYTTNTKLCGR